MKLHLGPEPTERQQEQIEATEAAAKSYAQQASTAESPTSSAAKNSQTQTRRRYSWRSTMTALNSEGLEKAAEALAKLYRGEGDEPFHLMATAAITAYLSALPPVDGLEVVAFRHPESDWAHVQYSEIDMHCRKDGPRPIPLVTLSQASSVIAGLDKRVEELERARDDAQTANASLSRLIDELDPKFELSRTIARTSSLEEENKRLREALAFYRDGFSFKTNKRYGGLEWHPTEALLDDCGNAARQALEDHNG